MSDKGEEGLYQPAYSMLEARCRFLLLLDLISDTNIVILFILLR